MLVHNDSFFFLLGDFNRVIVVIRIVGNNLLHLTGIFLSLNILTIYSYSYLRALEDFK